MQLEMIPCPRCEKEFPLKRKELGYHVCISCSTVEPVVGITTVEGTGDHTYNDLIIMDQSRYRALAERAAALTGKKAHIEMLDLDRDEAETTQLLKEQANRINDDDLEDEDEHDEEKERKKAMRY